VKSRERDYPLNQPVPLVTFSPQCTYREAAINCLNSHNIDYYVSMQSPSLAGVRGIVSSGMGVTLINRGLMTEDQCEWPEAKLFGSPREVRFVVRTTGRIPQIQAVLRSVYFSKACIDLSTPLPDCFTPPSGTVTSGPP